MCRLEREQEIRTTIKKAWDFIKKPRNINRITPLGPEFEIVSDVPASMFNGIIVEYIITIPFTAGRKVLTK
jgi:hypothetical protein